MARRWVVSIISTDYDLHDLRDGVASSLQDMGFDVVAFERNNFPVYPNVNSHDACLLALQGSDIVVLIIDRRYGGLYLGNGPLSITEAEYEEARARGKVVIPCVRRKTEDERFSYYGIAKQLEAKGQTRDDIRKDITPQYVESWKVLDFVERVRRADTDNFIIYFDELSDLQEHLSGRFEGLSSYVAHKIVQEQVARVKASKTTTLALSLGDVLDEGYFIDPPFAVLSGTQEGEKSASEYCDLTAKDRRTMVVGGPGAGKSTLLAKCFCTQASSCVSEKLRRIPFYLSLRGLGPTYHFDFVTYLDQCCDAYLGRVMWPCFNKDLIDPVFFIDGFDELSEATQDLELKRATESVFFTAPFVVCSRLRFAHEQLDQSAFASRFQTVVKLKEWDTTQAWVYVERFFNKRGHLELLDKMQKAYEDPRDMAEVFANPLLLTMLLWIVEQSKLEIPLTALDEVSIYGEFVEQWAKRELGRANKNGSSEFKQKSAVVTRAWQKASWLIYERRFTGGPANKTQLEEVIRSKYPELCEALTLPTFWDFFDVAPLTDEVRGTFHERFLEYLLAREIVDSCVEARSPFPQFLEFEIRYEVNKIVRALWKSAAEKAKELTLANLWGEYERVLDQKDAAGLMIRDHAMYYLGRLPHASATQRLSEADRREPSWFVKLSIGFGLMKLGDYDKESALFAEITKSPDWDTANRGYHLVYYGDWILRGEKPPYNDDELRPWPRTLLALLRHIKSAEPRHVGMRRIELFTIRRFIETRSSAGPVTDPTMREILEAIESMPDAQAGFKAKVMVELKALVAAYDKCASKSP